MRDNMVETEPAKATAVSRTMVTSAPNTIAERVPTHALLSASQTTTSTTMTDLTTVGPVVGPLTTGPFAIFMVSAFISNTTALAGGYMGCAVSGATTLAADTTRALRIISGAASENAKQAYIGMVSLNAGANTFTAKYAQIGAGTAAFSTRELVVFPL